MVIAVASLRTLGGYIGPLVCVVIKDFFFYGEMLKAFGVTKLVLIQKSEHVNSTSNFRPMSCFNVLYKCITKLICGRMEVLPSIIKQSKGAFVKGKELLYNVLIG